jgi:hypothetical protein
MSVINLLANDIWSEADIVSNGRTVIASQVSEARQNELRTIMLGHIAGMRTAAPEELAEIGLVQALTEQQVLDNAAARADMALLQSTLDYEAAAARLIEPWPVLPATVQHTSVEGVVTTSANPAVEQAAQSRAADQATVDTAAPEVLALHLLRNPPPVVEVVNA